MQPRILVGVPAYRGAEHIAETLRSIGEQEFAGFQVLISVDNQDRETARACEAFLADPRFRIVVHDKRLGWDRNINWLMAECHLEFFCYWQQDDFTTKDYLGSLIRFADDNPDFVCAFCDIQWFGDDQTRLSCPSITGFALTRALYFLESMNGVPFRGLIRKSAIDRIGPIRHTDFESAHEDFVWLARLARDGPLGRVAGPLYYKRWHAAGVSAKWDRRSPEWWRPAWIEFGIGMLEAILPAVPADQREAALEVVLERLCCPREGRRLSYDPGAECAAFAAEFLKVARARCGIPEGDDARLIGLVLRLQRMHARALEMHFASLTRELARGGRLELDFQPNGTGSALLDGGWSFPEEWGIWSNAGVARLRLPLTADARTWRIAFHVIAYAHPDHGQRVRIMIGDDEIARWAFESGAAHRKEVLLVPRENYPVLTFLYPDATSPQQRGESRDPRMLALGLMKVTVSEAKS